MIGRKSSPDLEHSANLRTRTEGGCLLGLLGFMQQVLRNLAFTNRSRTGYLSFSYK